MVFNNKVNIYLAILTILSLLIVKKVKKKQKFIKLLMVAQRGRKANNRR